MKLLSKSGSQDLFDGPYVPKSPISLLMSAIINDSKLFSHYYDFVVEISLNILLFNRRGSEGGWSRAK